MIYIDILILAMIAIFIINRLRNVLGKKTGNESDIVEKFTNLDTETLSKIHDSLEKGSPLAKYFNFNIHYVSSVPASL